LTFRLRQSTLLTLMAGLVPLGDRHRAPMSRRPRIGLMFRRHMPNG
jgi:hypothetical protein